MSLAGMSSLVLQNETLTTPTYGQPGKMERWKNGKMDPFPQVSERRNDVDVVSAPSLSIAVFKHAHVRTEIYLRSFVVGLGIKIIIQVPHTTQTTGGFMLPMDKTGQDKR